MHFAKCCYYLKLLTWYNTQFQRIYFTLSLQSSLSNMHFNFLQIWILKDAMVAL